MSNTLKWTGANLVALRAEIRAVQAAENHQPFWNEEVGPGLVLVADRGIYLMGWHQRPSPPKGQSLPVAYADGFDPELNADWYDDKIAVIGGDDCAEFLPLIAFIDTFEADVDGVYVKVTSTAFKIGVRRRAGEGRAA